MTEITQHFTRRRFFAATSVAAITVGTASCATTDGSAVLGAGKQVYTPDPTYPYEVRRTESEWRALLSTDEYVIMREGGTEPRKSSAAWQEKRTGTYSCKGCDLKVYDSRWKTILDKGWAFFFHSEPNAVMTDIDGPNPAYGMSASENIALTEVHCRRCGSHLGHHLIVDRKPLHCINGKALVFRMA